MNVFYDANFTSSWRFEDLRSINCEQILFSFLWHLKSPGSFYNNLASPYVGFIFVVSVKVSLEWSLL